MKLQLSLYNLVILLIILVNKFLFTNSYNIFLSISFLILTLIMYLKIGYSNSNKYLSKISISITLIIIFVYLVFTSLLGLLVGYSKNPLNYNFINIFLNIYNFIIVISCCEIIRFIITKKSLNDNFNPLITCILFILLDILIYTKGLNHMNSYNFFILLTTSLLPIIASHLISYFLINKVGFTSLIMLRLFYNIYTIVLPIYPNINNYLISLINIVIPYFIYRLNIKYISDFERTKYNKPFNNKLWYFNILSFSLACLLIILNTGIFRYKLLAIGSGSMEGFVNYGDAIIYKQLKRDNDYNKLKMGDVIVFNVDNNLIVHRITSITFNDSNLYVKTKGDQNEKDDPYVLHKKDILGKYVFKLRYLGIPSLLLRLE